MKRLMLLGAVVFAALLLPHSSARAADVGGFTLSSQTSWLAGQQLAGGGGGYGNGGGYNWSGPDNDDDHDHGGQCYYGWQWGNGGHGCEQHQCYPQQMSGRQCNYKGDDECCENNHHQHHHGCDQHGVWHDWWT